MRTVILTKGIPASGKTSWALKEMREHPNQYKRFNKDSMRRSIDNGRSTPDGEKVLRGIIYYGVEASLRKGYDIILDNTNFKDKDFLEVCDIAKRVGNVRVVEKYFDVSLKNALRYNKERNTEEMVPDHIIENMNKKYVKNKKVETRDVYFEHVTQSHNMKMDVNKSPCIIVDMDGTLAIATERDYYDTSLVITDTLNEFVETAIFSLQQAWGDRLKTIIVSGREDSCMIHTKEWLEIHSIKYDNIFMREDGDRRPDQIIKEEIYKEHIEPHFNTILVFDDRNSVVNMWRNNGLTCFQVADSPY